MKKKDSIIIDEILYTVSVIVAGVTVIFSLFGFIVGVIVGAVVF